MILKKLKIKRFGKIHDQTLEFSPGINILFGENESGKTTTYTFIRSMYYGIARQRGRGAKNDIYSRYEPWEGASDFGGLLWLEEEGEIYRLTRNFYKEHQSFQILNETDGTVSESEDDMLGQLLGGVSEIVYDNTVAIGQLKGVTGPELAREVQNYMASYQGAGDSFVDLGRASQMLKMWRKGYQVQKDRKEKEIEKEREKLSAKIDYLSREMEALQEKQYGVEQKKADLTAVPGDDSAEMLIEEKIFDLRKKLTGAGAAAVIAVILGITACFARIRFSDGMSRFGLDLCIVLAIVGIVFFYKRRDRLRAELIRQKKLKKRFLAEKEKLQWNQESLKESYEEKRTDFGNLQNEYEEYELQAYLPTSEDREIQALNLAMDTIQALSGNIHRQVGYRLRRRTSRILREITEGKYQEVLMDPDLHLSVNTGEKTIPVERLSRGTVEQIYFALRMAAGELLCGDTKFPVILDDVFGMYDEDRLAAVLNWLKKQERQVLICTCSRRELQILEQEGIPCNVLEFSQEK